MYRPGIYTAKGSRRWAGVNWLRRSNKENAKLRQVINDLTNRLNVSQDEYNKIINVVKSKVGKTELVFKNYTIVNEFDYPDAKWKSASINFKYSHPFVDKEYHTLNFKYHDSVVSFKTLVSYISRILSYSNFIPYCCIISSITIGDVIVDVNNDLNRTMFEVKPNWDKKKYDEILYKIKCMRWPYKVTVLIKNIRRLIIYDDHSVRNEFIVIRRSHNDNCIIFDRNNKDKNNALHMLAVAKVSELLETLDGILNPFSVRQTGHYYNNFNKGQYIKIDMSNMHKYMYYIPVLWSDNIINELIKIIKH